METCNAVEIGALKRLLEECRSKAADLKIADVAYILLMAETSIAEYLSQAKDEQSLDCPSTNTAEAPNGVRH